MYWKPIIVVSHHVHCSYTLYALWLVEDCGAVQVAADIGGVAEIRAGRNRNLQYFDMGLYPLFPSDDHSATAVGERALPAHLGHGDRLGPC